MRKSCSAHLIPMIKELSWNSKNKGIMIKIIEDPQVLLKTSNSEISSSQPFECDYCGAPIEFKYYVLVEGVTLEIE